MFARNELRDANGNLESLGAMMDSAFSYGFTHNTDSNICTQSIRAERVVAFTMDWTQYPIPLKGVDVLNRSTKQFDHTTLTQLRMINGSIAPFLGKIVGTELTIGVDAFIERVLKASDVLSYLRDNVEMFEHPKYDDVLFVGHPFSLTDIDNVKFYLVIANNRLVIDYFFWPI